MSRTIRTLVLKDAYKQHTLDQDKILSPRETVRRFREKLQTIDLDILSHTRRIDNGRLDIPVFFSVCGKDAFSLTGTKKQMGKGATVEQAEASATIELGERFSFFSFYHNPENFLTGRYRDLKGDALPFEMIARSVHDETGDIDAAKTIFETMDLRWTWGYNLTQDKPVIIPFDWFYAINEFNGTSAGNCVEEALCQGICEVVERHVSALISQNRLSVPLIDPGSAQDPMTVKMFEKYAGSGIRLFISDFTLDMGIPTVGVLAFDPSTFPEKSEIVWTAGTTPGPEKALSRALTETAQLAGDFNTGSNYVASGLPKFASMTEAEFITKSKTLINIKNLPDISSNNFKVEVENCIGALLKKDMNVIAVNTTHPLLDLPAFYTIVPGCHFRERALGTEVGMFCAKLVAERLPPPLALAQLKKIDAVLKNKYYVQFYMGTCLISMENFKEALLFLHRALELDPNPQDVPSIYSYMGVCHKEMGEYHIALESLKKGIVLDSERTDIHNLMGFCYFKLGENEKAIRCFQEVIRLDPGSAIDYANIASNYRDLGQTEKAIAYYKAALDIDPTIGFALENLEKLAGAVK